MICASFLVACSGGGTTNIYQLPTAAASPTTQPSGGALVQTHFTFLPPGAVGSAVTRHPHYITANVASIEVTLDSVNGAAPSTGSPLTVTSNINTANCPCTINGPYVQPSSATFTLAAYDQPNAGGNLISTASPTYTIVAGQTNTQTVVLNGVPSTLAIALPLATAGTPFASPQNISVTVKDGDGSTILGTYASPVTLSDSDTSGATAIATSGSDSPPAGALLSSSDVATIAYTGLAIAPISIEANAKAANATASFAPLLQPIVATTSYGLTPQPNPNFIGIDFQGTFATGTISASEVGWTNAPYNKTLAIAVPAGCASIGSVAPTTGTTFTATVSASPVAGTCAATLSDGSGQSQAVLLAYTNYAYTGTPQSITVPAGVTNIEVRAYGAQGGPLAGVSGGLGGEVDAIAPTVNAEVLWIYVGGNVTVTGGAPAGGFNGGGVSFAGLGGGASDVRTSFNNVNSRLIVAPGGGGAGDAGPVGGGGAVSGSNGGGPNPGIGATISGPGAGGTNGQPGTLGAGGTGSLTTGATGGGGGGGYYGGGGGGDSSGGGGGSSYIDSSCIATNVFINPVNSGNGSVVLIF